MNLRSKSIKIAGAAMLAIASTTLAMGAGGSSWTSATSMHAKYPCDVFSFNFCFRRPYGAGVLLESGPDFDIFRVIDANGSPAFSIYVGTTPERESGHATRLLSTRRGDIEVIVSAITTSSGNDELDVRIHYSTGLTVHVFGASGEMAEGLLFDVLQGFRRCEKKGFTSVKCESRSMFEEATIRAMARTR